MIVVVHGPPAAGKTTLARALGHNFEVEVISADALAENLYDTASDSARPSARHARAQGHELAFAALTQAVQDGRGVVFEGTLNPDLAARRMTSVLQRCDQRVAEVFLTAPADELLRRFSARARTGRHPVHEDDERMDRLPAHLEACRYQPLGLSDCVVRVETKTAASEVLAAVLTQLGSAKA